MDTIYATVALNSIKLELSLLSVIVLHIRISLIVAFIITLLHILLVVFIGFKI